MDLQPIIESARERVLEIKERDGLPGVAVALVSDGQPVWLEGFGSTAADGGRPIDAHTIFSIQSTSKNFTATAVMLGVQRGLLDLDAPITTYLPDFTVQSRFERDPQTKMTLRRLLSHRAGFTHEAPLGGNFDPELESAAPDFEAHVASIADTWLRYPVGQRYAYSNLGIDLAGAALAKVCRAPFADCLRTLVFEPLGMADSTADPAVYGPRENRAVGHQPSGAPVPVRIPIEASGGVYSSAADMARYAAFHLGKGRIEGRTILDPGLWEEMHTPSLGGSYALGVVRLPLWFEHGAATLLNHNGGGYGFGSCFIYDPEQGLAWVALFNAQQRLGTPPPFNSVALEPALTSMLGARVTQPLPAMTVAPTPEALSGYAGTYVAGMATMTANWEGDLFGFRLPPGDTFTPIALTADNGAVITDGPQSGQRVRLHPATALQPAWVEFEGVSFDLNASDGDPVGPISDAYDAFLGDYRIIQWGSPFMDVRLSKQNGYLYLAHIRLTEDRPGLLFSADGEALDLTRDPPAFRNIPLHRAPAS